MDVLVVTKRYPIVMKLVMRFHHMSLKVVEFMIEFYRESSRMIRLVWKPHNMKCHTCMSQ